MAASSLWPRVTVAVPLLDEAALCEGLVQALLALDYPREHLQILLIDGGSQDGTRERVQAVAAEHAHIRWLANPGRLAASALNLALAAAEGTVFARIDARCRPASDYIKQAVRRLQAGAWAGVAGPQIACSDHWPGSVYAAVLNHPLGTGAPAYRKSDHPRRSETLFLGVYRRAWLERVGGWDESFAANEDFDLNWRLRQAGGELLVDPQIRSCYLVRERLPELGRQYARYGAWRVRTWRKHPSSLRLRHLAPALLVLALLGSLLALPFAAWPVLAPGGSYLLGVALVALSIGRRLGWRAVPYAIAALLVLHLAWGGSFWLALLGLRKAS